VENRFEPLDGDEVLSVDESAQIFIGHRTFRVSEIATALKTQLLEYGLGGITAEKEGWFNPEGISCEALKFGANRWLKGRVKISIDFCPDEIQGLAPKPPAPAAPSPPVTPPPVLEEDELVTAMPEPSPVLDPDPIAALPEPVAEELESSSSDDFDLTAEDDLFAPTADAPDEIEEELDFGESLDLEDSGDVEQAAAEFWSDDDDDDFAVSPDESSDEDDFFGSELDDGEPEPEAIASPAPPAPDDDAEDVFGDLEDDGEDDIFGDDDDDADALVDDVFADAPVDFDGDDDDADALVDDVFADAPVDLDGDSDDEFDLGGDLFGEEETPATDEDDDDPFGELGDDDSLFDVSDEDELEPSPTAAAAADVVLEDADDIFGSDDTDWGLSGDDDLDFGDLDTATGAESSGQEDDAIADIWQDIDELS
jgi:hypothetical protein